VPGEDDGSQRSLFFDYDAVAFSSLERCRGALTIEPGRVTFVRPRWRRSVSVLNPIPSFEHRTSPVVAITPTLAPTGCLLVLLDPEVLGTRAIVVGSFARANSVLDALRRADFQVERYSTTVSIGATISTEAELELFRQAHRDRVSVIEGITGPRGTQDGHGTGIRVSPVDQWLGTSERDARAGRSDAEDAH
jgi:hypothetical protein